MVIGSLLQAHTYCTILQGYSTNHVVFIGYFWKRRPNAN